MGPSLVATLLITILYSRVQGSHLVQSGLHGLMAAAAAGSIMFSWRLASPAIRANLTRGRLVFSVGVVIVVASAVLVRTTQVPVFLMLLTGGGAMGLTLWVDDYRGRRAEK